MRALSSSAWRAARAVWRAASVLGAEAEAVAEGLGPLMEQVEVAEDFGGRGSWVDGSVRIVDEGAGKTRRASLSSGTAVSAARDGRPKKKPPVALRRPAVV